MTRFIDLPAELRNTIYELVLHDLDRLAVRNKHYFELHQTSRALTQVSRQIRAECLPIYYSTNTFLLSSTRDMAAWLQTVGRNCRHLRQVELLDGVVDGLQWPSHQPSQNQINFSMQLSNGSESNRLQLNTEEEVHPAMQDLALSLMKESEDVMRSFGAYDLILKGRISHCGHCLKRACRLCHKSRCCWRT